MKTTIEMAKEAFASRGAVDAWFKDAAPNFEAFVKMIRDEEREACAKICDSLANRDYCVDVRYAADAIRGRK